MHGGEYYYHHGCEGGSRQGRRAFRAGSPLDGERILVSLDQPLDGNFRRFEYEVGKTKVRANERWRSGIHEMIETLK